VTHGWRSTLTANRQLPTAACPAIQMHRDRARRTFISSGLHPRLRSHTRPYSRIFLIRPSHRPRSPASVPLQRNNYKIKEYQIKSSIEVNNSFKFFVDLDLTCVTGSLIFDNPKTENIP
jgi:hypothetical protein